MWFAVLWSFFFISEVKQISDLKLEFILDVEQNNVNTLLFYIIGYYYRYEDKYNGLIFNFNVINFK